MKISSEIVGANVADVMRTVEGIAEDLNITEWPVKAADMDKIAILLETLKDHADKLMEQCVRQSDREYDNSRLLTHTKALEKSLDDVRNNRDMMVQTIMTMCDLIVESNVTHGQKNGMVILMRDFLKRCTQDWRLSEDVPF